MRKTVNKWNELVKVVEGSGSVICEVHYKLPEGSGIDASGGQ